MMMQTAQLEETLSHIERHRPIPHILLNYFQDCYIRPESIAKALNVSKETVRNWLWGRSIPPKNQEAKLWELKKSLDRYEAKKGHKFDARKFEK